MTIDMKNTENFYYEQPMLKKYGTMKEFTFQISGSGGRPSDSKNESVFGDILLPGIGAENDNNDFFGNSNRDFPADSD